MKYQHAEQALSVLSTGQPLGRSLAIIAALAMKPLAEVPGASIDVRDAYRDLQHVADGGTLDLDLAGRRRAAQLAGMVREYRLEREQLLALIEPEEVGEAELTVRYGTR